MGKKKAPDPKGGLFDDARLRVMEELLRRLEEKSDRILEQNNRILALHPAKATPPAGGPADWDDRLRKVAEGLSRRVEEEVSRILAPHAPKATPLAGGPSPAAAKPADTRGGPEDESEDEAS